MAGENSSAVTSHQNFLTFLHRQNGTWTKCWVVHYNFLIRAAECTTGLIWEMQEVVSYLVGHVLKQLNFTT